MNSMFCSCVNHITTKIPNGDNQLREVCTKCDKVYYQNPKIIAGVLPLYENKILLCRRAIEPKQGFWTIPGGFMECQETVKQAALREAKEEAGIVPTLGPLHTVYDIPHLGQVYMLFLGYCTTDFYELGSETLECLWVTYEHIPWSEIAFSAVTFSLKHVFDEDRPHFGVF